MKLTNGDVCEIFVAIAARVAEEFVARKQVAKFAVAVNGKQKEGELSLWTKFYFEADAKIDFDLSDIFNILELQGALKLKEYIRKKINDVLDDE